MIISGWGARGTHANEGHRVEYGAGGGLFFNVDSEDTGFKPHLYVLYIFTFFIKYFKITEGRKREERMEGRMKGRTEG